MTSTEEEKRAQNEAAFRQANEQIRAAERSLDPPLERVPYICECDDPRCRDPIRLTAAEYEHVREDGATFAVANSHHSEGEVVEDHEQYLVVRKSDGGGAVAHALDPEGRMHERGTGEAGRPQRIDLPPGERADREPQS